MGLGTGLACGDRTTDGDCVPIDHDLDPPDHLWCGAQPFPPTQDWNGEVAEVIFVSIPAGDDGSCRLCPREEILAEVRDAAMESVADTDPNCVVERMEAECAWSEEKSIELGHDENYCRFSVAYVCED
jgi:hypothetical protein